VTGGFVVGGRVRDQLVAFHYELSERRCSAHLLGPVDGKHWTWYGVARALSVVVRSGTTVHGVDLGTKEHFSTGITSPLPGSRVQIACGSALRRDFPPPQVHAVNWTDGLAQDLPLTSVCLNPATGELTFNLTGWENFTPMADGRPTLKGAYVLRAATRCNTLALLCQMKHPTVQRLYVYRRSDNVPGWSPSGPDDGQPLR
jgi:hypothetical protein